MINPEIRGSSPGNRADAEKLADFIMGNGMRVSLALLPQLNKTNVSYPQFLLLTYLASEEYLTMTEIAKKMGHSTAAATGLVDRLEKLDFMERVHATEDRRKIMVRITAKGVEFVAERRKEIGEELHTIFSKPNETDKPV